MKNALQLTCFVLNVVLLVFENGDNGFKKTVGWFLISPRCKTSLLFAHNFLAIMRDTAYFTYAAHDSSDMISSFLPDGTNHPHWDSYSMFFFEDF